MPELPDLFYIQTYLSRHLTSRTITALELRQPVVLRSTIDQDPNTLLIGQTLGTVRINGPFIVIELSPSLEIVINLMVAGALQHQLPRERTAGHLCLSLVLSDGSQLNLVDSKKMAQCYLVAPGDYAQIPKFANQGVDVSSSTFTADRFRALASENRRRQVRVFINDHTVLSSIGNAYADEILFEARIHPKTFVASLLPHQIDGLYNAIRSVLAWGIAEVEKVGEPIHVKVRAHMKVRNRKGKPCPRCGTIIRREGVRGYDVFFCPSCQPASRKLFIDWQSGTQA